MPPDALQPKAYCTNPGLKSFLPAPPGVSTTDPSSERRNYLGEKCRLPRNIQGSFTCRKYTTWDKRFYFPSEGRCAEDFFALKNPTASAGLNPRTWVPKASTLPLDHQSRCWNDTDAGEPEYWKRNLSHCHFVHHKSHADEPGMKPGPPQSEAFKSCWPVLKFGYTVAPSTTVNTSSRVALGIGWKWSLNGRVMVFCNKDIRLQVPQKHNIPCPAG